MSEKKVLDITYIPIHKGSDIGSAMRATGNLINKAPGFRIAYWGVQLEHDDTMDLLVEWGSVAHHKAHLGTDLEKEITGIVWPLIDTSRPLITSHIPFDPVMHSKCLEAPFVEISTYKNIRDISVFEESIVSLDKAARKSKGYQGMVYGRMLEDDHKEEFAAIIGWSGLDVYRGAVSQGTFVQEVRRVKQFLGDVKSHHVMLTKWTA